MASITVEGSLMPAAGVLKRGERATWEDSARLRDLIRKGHLVLISEKADDNEDAPEPVGGHPPVIVEPPAKNASTEEWGSFLEQQGVEFDDDATRADLIAIWEAIPVVTGGEPPADG